MKQLFRQKFHAYRSVILITLGYGLMCKIANTLLFTLISSVALLNGKVGMEFSNTVNEIASQYVFVAYAIAASFVTAVVWFGDRALYVHKEFWNEPHLKPWQIDRMAKEELIRGMSSGAAVALIYLVVFSVANEISYLGVYITSTLGTPVFPLFFSDLLSLILFVYCEEYLFRHKILRALVQELSPGQAVLLSSFIYILIKSLQFQIETIDYINLFLLNFTLGYFYLRSGKAHRGLGFLTVLYGVLHPIAGLPLWSHTSPSFFLFKQTPQASQLLSGSSAGPLSSLGITSILLFFAVSSYVGWKKSSD